SWAGDSSSPAGVVVREGATCAEQAYKSGRRRLQLSKARNNLTLMMTVFICSAHFLVHELPSYDACRTHAISTEKRSGYRDEATPAYYFPVKRLFPCLLWKVCARRLWRIKPCAQC